MKDFIVNILFFSIILLMFWGGLKFSEYQYRELKNFEGLTHEQIVEGVEYVEKHSYNFE